MLHRVPVIVSALALLVGFVWAPYEHLHRPNGVQHSHMTSHGDDHHHESTPVDSEDKDHHTSILSVQSFLCIAGVRMMVPMAVEGPETPQADPPLPSVAAAEPSRPQSHDPPLDDRLRPRAPPVDPAL